MARVRFAVAFVILVPMIAVGATRIWTGAVSDRWSDPRNWTSGTPASGDTLVFLESSQRKNLVNDLPAGTMFHSITVRGWPQRYEMTGNAVSIGAGGMSLETDAGMLFDQIDLAGSQTWSGSGIKIVGPTNVNGQTLTLSLPYWSSLWFRDLSGTGHVIASGHLLFIGRSHFDGTLDLQVQSTAIGGDGAGAVLGDINVKRPYATSAASGVGELALQSAQVGNVTMSPGTRLFVTTSSGAPQPTVRNLTFMADTGPQTTLYAQFTGLIAKGSVTLASVACDPAPPVRTNSTEPFVLIDNQSGDAIRGEFLGMPEDAIICGPSGTTQYRITYKGGTGNDVILTQLASNVAVTTTSLHPSTYSARPGEPITLTATVQSFLFFSGPRPPGPDPVGVVSFWDGNVRLAIVPLDSSHRASFTTTLDIGSHFITAAYEGSPMHAVSSSGSAVDGVPSAIPTFGTWTVALLALALTAVAMLTMRA